jgi:hypothetical protein
VFVPGLPQPLTNVSAVTPGSLIQEMEKAAEIGVSRCDDARGA